MFSELRFATLQRFIVAHACFVNNQSSLLAPVAERITGRGRGVTFAPSLGHIGIEKTLKTTILEVFKSIFMIKI